MLKNESLEENSVVSQTKTNIEYGPIIGTIAWLFVFILLGFAFNKYVEVSANPVSKIATLVDKDAPHIRTTVLEMNHNNQYIAPGKINEQKVYMLLDTGATLVSVPESLAIQLGLTFGEPVNIYTASGEDKAFKTTIAKLHLGNITLTNVAALISPSNNSDIILLGMSALKDLNFSQADGKLSLSTTSNQ